MIGILFNNTFRTMKKKTFIFYLTSLIISSIYLFGCNNTSKNIKKTTMSDNSAQIALPKPEGFEKIIDGKQTHYFILKNKNGVQASFTNYGAHLVGLLIPDKSGKLIDVVVGFNDIDGYKKTLSAYYGATVGRYGNRIANGKFKLEGKSYTLFINNKPNTLHGGKKGFNDVVWDAKQINNNEVQFTYLSKDLEEGYPGNLNCTVTYELTEDNAVKISYEATTDKTTVINLTNHSYFNLNGIGSGNILNHI